MANPQTIQTLVRQTARWSTASMQDQSPLIRLLHANYGMAYATALREVASDQEISQVAGVDALWLAQKAAEAQDSATMQAVERYPQLAPRGPLVGLASEGLPQRYGQAAKGVSGVPHRLAEGLIFGLGLSLAKIAVIGVGVALAATGIGAWWVNHEGRELEPQRKRR